MSKYESKVGDIFGEWTVVDSNHKNLTASRARHYLCKCSCGLTERYVSATDLINKRSKRCNRCSLFSGVEELSGTYVAVVKKGAKLRNIEFSINPKYMVDLYTTQNKKCALTGMDITLHRNYSQGNRDKQTASLDRIDSTKGYVDGNVQWIHKDVNIMKNKFNQEYFIELCKKIAEHNDNTSNR